MTLGRKVGLYTKNGKKKLQNFLKLSVSKWKLREYVFIFVTNSFEKLIIWYSSTELWKRLLHEKTPLFFWTFRRPTFRPSVMWCLLSQEKRNRTTFFPLPYLEMKCFYSHFTQVSHFTFKKHSFKKFFKQLNLTTFATSLNTLLLAF